MNHFAVTTIGEDRPGIVAAVSEVLYRLNCNIEDSQMTILRGHFTIMLLVSVPEGITGSQLEQELDAVRGELELEAVVVRPVKDVSHGHGEADHTLTVYGADHTGIVALVTGRLAALGVNIIDLNTRLVDGDGSQLYIMVMDLTLPQGLTEEKLRAELERVGREADVEVSLQPRTVDVL